MSETFKVVHYTENGHDLFNEYLRSLRDKVGRNVIERSVWKIETGHFGEHKPCREGVWELVINYGPGYRVYYSIVGKAVVLLICAGTKKSQQKDIDKAVECLRKFKKGNN